MKRVRNISLVIISLISFAIVSACLFAMFFIEADANSNSSLFSLICGMIFWIFTIVGIALQIFVSISIRSWYERRRLYRSRFRRTRIGLLSIFSNIPAIISDVVLFVSLVAFIAFMVIDPTNIFAYISLSVLFLSFSAHCIFNGKNYYYITNYKYIKAQLMKSEEK